MIIYSERHWKKWCMILQDVTRKFTTGVNDIVYTIPRNVVLACVSYVQTSIDLTSWFDDETCVSLIFRRRREGAAKNHDIRSVRWETKAHMRCTHGDHRYLNPPGQTHNGVYSNFHILHESNNVTMRTAAWKSYQSYHDDRPRRRATCTTRARRYYLHPRSIPYISGQRPLMPHG